jgi:hypothetical protein
MKFNCKEISISDEEFGCTLTLSENKDDGISELEMTTEEVFNSIGRYVMLQRTYPEDRFEEDYYYFESSDFDKSGELNDFEINLSRKVFQMTLGNEIIEIQIGVDDSVYENLKQIIKKISNGKGKINLTSNEEIN